MKTTGMKDRVAVTLASGDGDSGCGTEDEVDAAVVTSRWELITPTNIIDYKVRVSRRFA